MPLRKTDENEKDLFYSTQQNTIDKAAEERKHIVTIGECNARI